MAEQFRVVRRKHERRTVQNRAQLAELVDARLEKMAGVFVGGAQRGGAVVNLFLPRLAGDAMVFDAGETARVGGGQIRFDVIEIQVETDVAVKIAVTDIAGIALLLAPDLAGGLEIAPERGDAVGREDRARKRRNAGADGRARMPCVSVTNQRMFASCKTFSMPSTKAHSGSQMPRGSRPKHSR